MEEEELGSSRLYRLAGGGAFVGRQVVQDHYVAGAERRREHLLEVGKEPGPGHRSLEHHRRGHAFEA